MKRKQKQPAQICHGYVRRFRGGRKRKFHNVESETP
jgi:hypothetical protein